MREALEELDSLEVTDNTEVSFLNLRGCCYVQLRQFGSALKDFDKARRLAPHNTGLAFNSLEMRFVMGDLSEFIEQAELFKKRFASDFPEIIELVEFKELLGYEKLNRMEEFDELVDRYRNVYDRPIGHFVRAIESSHAGENISYSMVAASARLEFEGSKSVMNYVDTLAEWGHLNQGG